MVTVSIRSAVAAALAALLAGCMTTSGSGDFAAGEEVRADVLDIWTASSFEQEIAAARTMQERENLRRLIGPMVEAGRAIQYRCAKGDNEIVIANAVLPSGMQVKRGEAVRISVGGEADSVPNRVLGRTSSPRLQRGSFPRPYGGAVSLTPWAGYVKDAPVEPWVEAEYARINTSHRQFLIRCRAPA